MASTRVVTLVNTYTRVCVKWTTIEQKKSRRRRQLRWSSARSPSSSASVHLPSARTCTRFVPSARRALLRLLDPLERGRHRAICSSVALRHLERDSSSYRDYRRRRRQRVTSCCRCARACAYASYITLPLFDATTVVRRRATLASVVLRRDSIRLEPSTDRPASQPVQATAAAVVAAATVSRCSLLTRRQRCCDCRVA